MPNEIAMAVPNRTSSPAAASATKRSQIPRIKVMPRKVSAIVAAQARNGIVNAGIKELTFAVYSIKCLKLSGLVFSPQIPKRPATADKTAAPSANRAKSIAKRYHLTWPYHRIGFEETASVKVQLLIVIGLLWREPA